jgi:hypothetical protein
MFWAFTCTLKPTIPSQNAVGVETYVPELASSIQKSTMTEDPLIAFASWRGSAGTGLCTPMRTFRTTTGQHHGKARKRSHARHLTAF